tara:strand:- start:67 stop:498 length:432 start_codon:yes stop_codon:yes gene_type:complete
MAVVQDTKHLYTDMQQIEQKRMESDYLYSLFMNMDVSELNKTCKFFTKKLRENYPNMSPRFSSILYSVEKESNRLIKHSLILFALYQEPWAVEYILKDEKSDPEKISRFVQKDLKQACEQLLKGAFTSMQSYVEDARWSYVMI